MATNIGTIELLATIDTSQYKRGKQQIENDNADLESSTEKTSGKMSGAFTAVAKVGLAAIASAAVAVGALIVKNFDNAIKRVDTLNNSSRTFENLGFDAKSVDSAMKALDQSIRGLPTPLDQAVRGVQMISGATNDIGKSQKIFSALNNAILGFGGTADDVSGAVLQISQAFSNGRIDATTWNSLMENNLGPTLNALARQMGITTGQLKEGLSEGTISVETFQDSLIKLNKEGGGGMKSLETIAKDATGGIGTGMENLNTAISRGIASIIESIGSENISAFITNVSKGFESALKNFGLFVSFVITNKDVFAPIIIAMSTIIGLLTAWFVATKVLAAGQAILNAVMLANPIGLVVIAIIGLVAAFMYLWNNVEGFRNFFIGVWGAITGAVYDAWKFITNTFNGLVGWFSNLWSRITSLFSTVGTSIGNAIGGAFKSVINSIIRGAVNYINGFIRSINNAVGVINKIPGVEIGRIGELSVPQLAKGGIVDSPTLAMIGEGRESEAVIPLSKLDKMMNGDTNGGKTVINIHLDGVMARSTSDLRDIAKELVGLIDQERASKQQPLIMGVNT